MPEVFGIPIKAFFGQLTIGLINGSFYALLSMGLALIFGLLRIINFAHGAQYMIGAFVGVILLRSFSVNYWMALIIAPLAVGLFGIILERIFIRPLYRLDHAYSLLLTFGLAMILEGSFVQMFGAAGNPYPTPEIFRGVLNLGFMILPKYRAWVLVVSVVVCLLVWLLIEKTKLGAYLRAATENPDLLRSFGVNVPVMVTLTYGAGVALAGFAGVLAAPIYQVSPHMGADLIIVVFAVVVIGGMGSIYGAGLTGFIVGLVEGMTRVFYSEFSEMVIFLLMAVVLLIKPAGLFGRTT